MTSLAAHPAPEVLGHGPGEVRVQRDAPDLAWVSLGYRIVGPHTSGKVCPSAAFPAPGCISKYFATDSVTASCSADSCTELNVPPQTSMACGLGYNIYLHRSTRAAPRAPGQRRGVLPRSPCRQSSTTRAAARTPSPCSLVLSGSGGAGISRSVTKGCGVCRRNRRECSSLSCRNCASLPLLAPRAWAPRNGRRPHPARGGVRIPPPCWPVRMPWLRKAAAADSVSTARKAVALGARWVRWIERPIALGRSYCRTPG